MFRLFRGRSLKDNIVIVGIIFLFLGIMFIVMEINNRNFLNKEPVDINEVDSWSELKDGMHVHFDAKYAWDAVISNVEENRVYGIKVSERQTSITYLLPEFYYHPDYDEFFVDHFIGLTTSDTDVLNRMVKELDEWYVASDVGEAYPHEYCTTTYKVDGRIRKAKKQEYEYMLQYFTEQGMDKATAEEMVLPYIIVRVTYSSGILIAGIVFAVLGAVLIAAIIIVAKKKTSPYGMSAAPVNVSREEPQYYGPEGLSKDVQPTYKYGGTNTYGTNDVYSSSYTGHGSEVDEATGLSAEFLSRMAKEKEDREREAANQMAIEANAAAYAANPLFGNEPAVKPMTASQSFSSYDKVVDPSTFNQNTNNSGLAVDPSILYGTAPAQPVQSVYSPANMDINTEVNSEVNSYISTSVDTSVNSNPLFGAQPAQPMYQEPAQSAYQESPLYSAPQQSPLYGGQQSPLYGSYPAQPQSDIAMAMPLSQAAYQAQPAQPMYQEPAQSTYQAPVQPMYQAPSQPAYQAQPVQSAYQAPSQPVQAAQPTQPVQLPTGAGNAPAQALSQGSAPVTLPSGNGIYSTAGDNNKTFLG